VTGVLGGKTSTNTTATNVFTVRPVVGPFSSETSTYSGNFNLGNAKVTREAAAKIEAMPVTTPAEIKAQAAALAALLVAAPTRKPAFRIDDGNTNGDGSSRIGFKGTEDLGGGLKAVFQFEAGVNVDDGSSGNGGGNLFSRTAIVGLDGGFGRATFGRQLTPSFLVYNGSTAMGTMNGLADTSAALRLGTVRESNSAMYTSPDFSGFRFRALVAAPEARTQTESIESTSSIVNGLPAAGGYIDTVTSEFKPSTTINLALNYANGPLGLGFGYEQGKNSTTQSIVSVNPAVAAASSSTNEKVNTWNIGASYDFGVVKPFVNYANNKKTGSTGNYDSMALTTGYGDTDSKRTVLTLGFTAPMGTGLLFAEYANGKTKGWSDNSTTTVANVTTATNNLAGLTQSDKSNAFSVGYRYPLSKRTWLQAAYGQLKSTQDSTYATSITQPSGTIESDVTTIRSVTKNSGLAMTLSHNF
jgi:predicted porin